MEFGQLPLEQLDKTDFTLPPDSNFNKDLFSKQSPSAHPLIRVGCAKWGRKEWVGKIYPPGTKEADFLQHYVKHFNSIELNATSYKVYGPDTIGKWAAAATGKDFLFSPKMPNSLSNLGSGVTEQVEAITNRFINGIRAFGEHLGPVFLLTGDHFSPAKKDNLYAYLKILPKDIQFFVEVRHHGWYDNKEAGEEYFSTLRDLNIGAVITDTAGRRDCLHMQLPIAKTFIRFVGNNLHPTDYSRLDQWVERVKSWMQQGLQELYFFMHHTEERESPELCDYFIERLNKECNTTLSRPEFLTMSNA